MGASLTFICVAVGIAVAAARTPIQDRSVTVDLTAAAAGDPDAQFMLGEQYRVGHGVAADPDIAADWYRRAATQGNRQAARRLGLLLGEKQTWNEAIIWLNFANAGGDPRAAATLAMRATDNSTAQDRELAARLINAANAELTAQEVHRTQLKPQTNNSATLATKPNIAGGRPLRSTTGTAANEQTDKAQQRLVTGGDRRTYLVQMGAYTTALRAQDAWASATTRLPSLRSEQHAISHFGSVFRLTIEMQSLAAARLVSERLAGVAWRTIIRSDTSHVAR